jgi:hypothetical protein
MCHGLSVSLVAHPVESFIFPSVTWG